MLNPALAGDTSPIQWKKDYTVPEMELVGRTRPPLFGDGFNLRKEAADAFDTMRRAAGAEGINMYSASSFRSFNRQKGIWNRKYIKYTKEGKSPQEAIRAIIEYSTLPGSSRHHWGTDLDIIDTAVPQPKDHPLIATHFHEGGAYQKLFEWLLKHANKYG
ncbi:D-alanyl-D-alanine carboxypeptidase family protein, partial [bacterium]|nr:D-alanyl-D-alanine carboxypeptidase family protein [bacterium]